MGVGVGDALGAPLGMVWLFKGHTTSGHTGYGMVPQGKGYQWPYHTQYGQTVPYHQWPWV